MKTLVARARVQLTLDIAVPDTWRSDCVMDQIWKQANESAIAMLQKGVHNVEHTIVGEPVVTAVLVGIQS